MRDISHDLRLRFVGAAACWSAGLLLLLRSPFGERAIVAPLVAWQAALASPGSGASPVTVDASCSASDILALSAAVMLAYPVAWRRRLWGVAVGSLWVVTLNLARLITLTNTAGTPLFMPLHFYVWPAILISAATLFVFTWMWMAETTPTHTSGGASGAPGDRGRVIDVDVVARWRRLIIATAVLLTGYVIAAPLLLQADALQRAAMMMARGAASALGLIGVEALTGGSTLVVNQRPFLVTPECIVSPLMPLYLAWSVTWPSRLQSRAVALLLFLPLFVALGFVRLLTVAMPALIGPPLFLTHGFYQLLLGALIVVGTARVRAVTTGEAAGRAIGYAVLASLLALVVAQPYSAAIVAAGHAVREMVESAPLTSLAVDLQGAVAILPAYQLALLCGLTIAWFGPRGWRPLMVLTPIAACLQIAAVAVSDLATDTVRTGTPTLIRAFSIAVPCVLVAMAAFSRRQTRAAAAVPAELRA